MDRAARTDSSDARKKGRSRIGMVGFTGAGALCALIIWAAVIRDQLVGPSPLRAIRSRNVVERQAAALVLPDQWVTNPDEALDALARALSDEDVGTRAMAAQSLGSLACRLRDHPPTEPTALTLLKRRIDVAMRGLLRSLSDRDAGVRATAATCLGLMARRPGPGAPTPEQLAALKDESNAVRRRTASIINGQADMPLPSELVAALQDESAEVRVAAVRAIERFGPDLDPQIPALITMLERDERGVRTACAGALATTWPTPALVPTLIEFLKSRDRSVRGAAAGLLGRIGPEASQSVPALIAVLRDPFDLEEGNRPDADVSPGYPAFTAAQALAQMGGNPRAIAALAAVISPEKIDRAYIPRQTLGKPRRLTGDDRARWAESLRITAAVQALGDIGPPAVAAVPALIAAYNKGLKTPTINLGGIPVALGRIAPHSAAAPDAIAALIRALDSDNLSDRLGAAEALGYFGVDAAAAIPKLQTLEQDADDSYIRAVVAKSLAALDGQSNPHAKESETGRPESNRVVKTPPHKPPS